MTAILLRCAVQVTLQIYNIIPPVLLGVYYNVRIQLESTQGLAGFYCNPSWGGQPDETNTIAQPKNAVWETGIVVPVRCCVVILLLLLLAGAELSDVFTRKTKHTCIRLCLRHIKT